jgi:hypothetical protein
LFHPSFSKLANVISIQSDSVVPPLHCPAAAEALLVTEFEKKRKRKMQGAEMEYEYD